MQRRRKFLLSTGALALGGIGTATARRSGNGPSKEAFHNTFHNAIQRGGAEEARRALDNLGVDAVVKEAQSFDVASEEELEEVLGGDSDVTPEKAYEDPRDSDSTLHVSVGSVSGEEDQVWVATSMSLDGCSKTIRNSWWIQDAIGVGFIDQDWAAMGKPTVAASQEHTARFTEEDVANDALAGTVTIENHREDNTASCDSIPPAGATLTGEFRLRDGGEPSTIWGSYSHTIAPDPWGSLGTITGGVGGIQVSTSAGATTYWSIADPIDPEPYL